MKILIFSDSHGDVETMCGAVEREKPDRIVYLGDGIADAEQVMQRYPCIEMIKVLGGVDSDKEDEEWFKTVEIGGKRFIMTHGHTLLNEWEGERRDRLTDRNRITSRNAMLKMLDENDADIFLHGHTHEPYINRAQTPLGRTCWIMNPGSIRRGNLNAVYGVLHLEEMGVFKWQFVEVE